MLHCCSNPDAMNTSTPPGAPASFFTQTHEQIRHRNVERVFVRKAYMDDLKRTIGELSAPALRKTNLVGELPATLLVCVKRVWSDVLPGLLAVFMNRDDCSVLFTESVIDFILIYILPLYDDYTILTKVNATGRRVRKGATRASQVLRHSLQLLQGSTKAANIEQVFFMALAARDAVLSVLRTEANSTCDAPLVEYAGRLLTEREEREAIVYLLSCVEIGAENWERIDHRARCDWVDSVLCSRSGRYRRFREARQLVVYWHHEYSNQVHRFKRFVISTTLRISNVATQEFLTHQGPIPRVPPFIATTPPVSMRAIMEKVAKRFRSSIPTDLSILDVFESVQGEHIPMGLAGIGGPYDVLYPRLIAVETLMNGLSCNGLCGCQILNCKSLLLPMVTKAKGIFLTVAHVRRSELVLSPKDLDGLESVVAFHRKFTNNIAVLLPRQPDRKALNERFGPHELEVCGFGTDENSFKVCILYLGFLSRRISRIESDLPVVCIAC